MRTLQSALLGPFTLLLLGAPALADKIFQTNGKVIDDVSIVEETLTAVVYKNGNNQQTVPSERVLSVSFDKYPRLVDEAEAAILDEDFSVALEKLDTYVDAQANNPEKRRKWAPAFAAWRAVNLRIELADVQGVVASADRLIKGFPESRYLPGAYLAKAGAQLEAGDANGAGSTLTEFQALIDSKGLSKRWQLESRLAQIQADRTSSGSDKRTKLEAIATEAGTEFPTVKSRAQVVEGETYLQEAEKKISAPDEAAALREKARKIFFEIVDEFKADETTLAAAYTGLGDCFFYDGATGNDSAKLQQAVMYYLRVAVVYEGQSRYVPRALFFAMKCGDLLQDRSLKNDMHRELRRLYPSSPWLAEAEKL